MWPFSKIRKKLRPIYFSVEYEHDPNGDNHEWRNVYSNIKTLLEKSGTFVETSVPPFVPEEDFTVILTTFNGNQVAFSSDRWLWNITLDFQEKETAKTLRKLLEPYFKILD